MLTHLFHGFSLALADSVPGVSGGTVAFILGFYERFINALHDLFGKDGAQRKQALVYLCKLGVGWVAGMSVSVMLLAKALDSNIYFLSSLFMGLTAASIPFIVVEERKTLAGSYGRLIYTLLGAALVCALTAARASFQETAALDYMALQPLSYLYLFVSGMFAIVAMVLPGISGSSLLLIFGVYAPTIQAVHSLMRLDLGALPGLLTLAAGAALGVGLSIHFIRAAFKKHRAAMLYLVFGMMLGSLYAIAMGPATLSIPQPPMNVSTFSLPGFLLGAIILVGLEGTKLFTKPAQETQAKKPLPLPVGQGAQGRRI